MARILICEKAFLDRSLLERLLRPLGACDLATSLDELEARVRSAGLAAEPYDVITLDEGMLRQHPELGDHLSAEQGQCADVVSITKPVDEDEVRGAIRRLSE